MTHDRHFRLLSSTNITSPALMQEQAGDPHGDAASTSDEGTE